MLQKLKQILKKYWLWIIGVFALVFATITAVFRAKKQDQSIHKTEYDKKIDGINTALEIKNREASEIELANSQAIDNIKNIEEQKEKDINNLLNENKTDDLSKLLAKTYNIHYEDKKP